MLCGRSEDKLANTMVAARTACFAIITACKDTEPTDVISVIQTSRTVAAATALISTIDSAYKLYQHYQAGESLSTAKMEAFKCLTSGIITGCLTVLSFCDPSDQDVLRALLITVATQGMGVGIQAVRETPRKWLNIAKSFSLTGFAGHYLASTWAAKSALYITAAACASISSATAITTIFWQHPAPRKEGLLGPSNQPV